LLIDRITFSSTFFIMSLICCCIICIICCISNEWLGFPGEIDAREFPPTDTGEGDVTELADRSDDGEASIFTKFLAAEAANSFRSAFLEGDDSGTNGTEVAMTGADGTGIGDEDDDSDMTPTGANGTDDDCDAATCARVLEERR
jgi:hypothetical protein